MHRSPEDVARIIEDFLDGRGGDRGWDTFTSFPIDDPRLDAIRERCSRLDVEFPHSVPGHYCGDGGFEVMRQLARDLRATKD